MSLWISRLIGTQGPTKFLGSATFTGALAVVQRN